MSEDPQQLTLQQRIASLNAAHVGRVPGVPPFVRPKPQVPTKRPAVIRNKSINNPPEQINGSIADSTIGNQPNGLRYDGLLPPPTIIRPTPDSAKQARSPPPPLPTRQTSLPPPSLPSRRPSKQDIRRDSVESNSSASGGSTYSSGTNFVTVARTRSNDSASRVKAPAWGEAELPPLPVRGKEPAKPQYSSQRPKYAVRAPSSTTEISPPTILADQKPQPTKAKPSLPPRLPPRKQAVEPPPVLQQATIERENARNIPPIPSAADLEKVKRSALSFGLKKEEDIQPQPAVQAVETHDPPPVPLGSRPDLSTLQASKPRPNGTAATTADMAPTTSTMCLTCRDFSASDHYASLFPRAQVTSLPQLAQQLTSPFPSLTDKARAIFTWLHYNVRYDVDSFFAGNVRPSTPQSTLQSGLAVCEGYAALFTNLATHAGLESVVISGHGKGYGYTPLAPGSPLPPYNAGHAWNAVRIDDGEWKLLDACWGAGHVQGKGQPYIAKFTPQYFTMSNEEFGIKHFPGNKDMFFLPSGRRMSWEEYIQINPASWPLQVEAPTIFTSSVDYGIGERTVMPRSRKISPRQGGIIRFQFSLYCPHWTVEGHTQKGPPPVFIIATHGLDGRNKDFVPLEHVRGQNPGGGGDFWFCDIDARDLGAAGQTITLFAVTSFGDRQNTRGLTVREFREGKGRVGMGFQGVAAWDLV
jgi:transglutaminase-like putative cysteine protease